MSEKKKLQKLKQKKKQHLFIVEVLYSFKPFFSFLWILF